MANRDLESTQFRKVTQQVVENPSALLSAGAEIGETILRQRAEAKITENISKAQLELGQLEHQYRIDFQGNPMEGMAKFKEDREEIFNRLGEDISPLYGRSWQDKTRAISTRNDATQQVWALKQSRVNMIDSVNDTMKNNFSQSSIDGRSFGMSDESEIEAFVNFGTSMEELEEFATKNLGAEKAEELMETYEEDYMKSFISGVSETNPHKALEIMNSDIARDGFSNPDQFMKLKTSLEARAARFDKSNKQKREAANLAGTNSLLPKVGQMGYAELQANFSEFNTSSEAKAFYEEVNGYANTKRALTPEEKAGAKNKFHVFMADVIGKEDLSNNDIQLLQDSIYAGMRKGALSKNEGFTMLNDILMPVLEQQQERADKFETGKWNPFQENLGLGTLNKEIENITGISRIEKPTDEQAFNHNKNANMIYDVYLQSLGQQAKERQTSIAGLSSLGFAEEQKIYNKALTTAKETFIRANFSSMSGQKELPATVVKPIANTNLSEKDIDSMSEQELDEWLAKQ